MHEIIGSKNYVLNNLRWNFTAVIMNEKTFLKFGCCLLTLKNFYQYICRGTNHNRTFPPQIYRVEFLKANGLQPNFPE